MASITLTVNNQEHTVDVPPEMPLLWVLRDFLDLPGTKFGCGIGLCGSCAVHINGQAVRSCVTPVSAATGQQIITIEELAADQNHPLIKAWLEETVAQCGYCQPGQIMSAAALLAQNPTPSDQDIDGAMSAVLCRCGTYQRIRKAIHRAAQESQQ